MFPRAGLILATMSIVDFKKDSLTLCETFSSFWPDTPELHNSRPNEMMPETQMLELQKLC